MTVERVEQMAARSGLFVMGTLDNSSGTLMLLGAGKPFWPIFQHAPEMLDGRPDPLDRWSKRVIGRIAAVTGADDCYPSDGPPYAPFIDWSLQTKRFFKSPTGMMVHDSAGLMISIRGALQFSEALAHVTPPSLPPCDTCADRPCVAACPVDALSENHAYDVPACKSYLDVPGGKDCMQQGCLVRRACPISIAFERSVEQSAFHMAAFKG